MQKAYKRLIALQYYGPFTDFLDNLRTDDIISLKNIINDRYGRINRKHFEYFGNVLVQTVLNHLDETEVRLLIRKMQSLARYETKKALYGKLSTNDIIFHYDNHKDAIGILRQLKKHTEEYEVNGNLQRLLHSIKDLNIKAKEFPSVCSFLEDIRKIVHSLKKNDNASNVVYNIIKEIKKKKHEIDIRRIVAINTEIFVSSIAYDSILSKLESSSCPTKPVDPKFLQNIQNIKNVLNSAAEFIRKNSHIDMSFKPLQFDELSLPPQLEAILFMNLQITTVSDENGDITLDKTFINWRRIEAEIESWLHEDSDQPEFRFHSDFTDKFSYTEKEKINGLLLQDIDEIMRLKASFQVLLLQKSFLIVNEFFPINKYGLPEARFLELLMNFFLDPGFIIETDNIIDNFTVNINGNDINWCFNVMRSNDCYAILKEKENKYLCNKLKQLNPDINIVEEMYKDGFANSLFVFDKILGLNPAYAINLRPEVEKTNLKDNLGNIYRVVDRLKNDDGTLDDGCIKSLITVSEKARLYMKLRFCDNKSYQEIHDYLNDNKVHKSYSIVCDEIKELSSTIGFDELNSQIETGKPDNLITVIK